MTEDSHREPPPGTKRHYWHIDPDMPDDEIEMWAEHFVDTVLGDAAEQGETGELLSSDDPGVPLAEVVNPFGTPSRAIWTELIYDIEIHLDTLASGDGGFLVLNVERPDDPFVQFVVDGLGCIEAEAASTMVADYETKERRRVDPVTERRLLRLGWFPPDADPLRLAQPGEHPNFYRTWTGDAGYPGFFVELGVRTLVEAFGVSDPTLVVARGDYFLDGKPPARA